MMEGSGKNVSRETFMEAINVGVVECQKIINGIKSLQSSSNITKRSFSPEIIDNNLKENIL